jgi:hypothetical protein
MVDIDMAQWPALVKVNLRVLCTTLYADMMQIIMASNTFYFLCNWAVKHALLLFYLELTCTPRCIHLIYFMHFVAFGFGFSSILVSVFQCRPIMLVTDCVLYAMPLVFTWGLQLRSRQRWGLKILFGLGGL